MRVLVRHFLEVVDEPQHLNIEFLSFRENDSNGALGRAMMVILGAVAELERNLIIERVRAGMRRAKLAGQHIGSTMAVMLSQAESWGSVEGTFRGDGAS